MIGFAPSGFMINGNYKYMYRCSFDSISKDFLFYSCSISNYVQLNSMGYFVLIIIITVGFNSYLISY